MKVRCRAFYGDLIRLDVDGHIKGFRNEYLNTYYLVIKQDTGETIEINRVFGEEIEVVNDKKEVATRMMSKNSPERKEAEKIMGCKFEEMSQEQRLLAAQVISAFRNAF